jgi:hypothetical protein
MISTLTTYSLMTMQKSNFLFFKRNNRGEDCIIDVKDAVTGKTLSYNDTIDKYVVKVETHRAILE